MLPLAPEQVQTNGFTRVQNGLQVVAGGATVVGGLTVSPGGTSISGTVTQLGSLSITASKTTSAILDVYDSNSAFSGNLIAGRTPVGITTGNLLYVQDGTNTLLQVGCPALDIANMTFLKVAVTFLSLPRCERMAG